MVNFLWPDALWLMVALPVLVIAYVESCRRRDRAYLRYATLRLVREALASPQWLRRHAPPLLFLLGLAAALLAIARPVAVTTEQQGTVILAIDVSPSMAATDVAPTRLAAARAAMASFVRAQAGNVRIGIVAFGGNARVVQYPTTNRSDVLTALDRLALQPHTGIGTALVASILTLYPAAGVDGEKDIFDKGWEAVVPRNALLAPFSPMETSRRHVMTPIDFSTAIILVSDGCGTIGVSHLKAAELAAERGIRVYTVGVGTPYGGTAKLEGWGPIHAEFQEETLREVAHITRGEYFHARSAGGLNRIYGELTTQAVNKRTEMTVPLTLIGVALLLAASVLSLLWWHRFPVSRPGSSGSVG